jgi:Mrr N-terminal domain
MDKNDLKKWRISLEDEIRQLEARFEPLAQQLRTKHEQLKALETLIRASGGEDPPESAPAAPMHYSPTSPRSGMGKSFTPTDAYWIPILESLTERGGREHCDVILDMVEKKLARILTPEDHELLPSGISCRWRNRAQWQRQNMIQQGLLSKHSVRGVWEITKEGRAWLSSRKGGAAA